jgi:hypothetical protein
LKFQYLHAVRWVASKVCVLTAFVTDWKSLIVHLESIVATEKCNITAVADGLLKNLKDFKFIYMIHFLVDYVCILKSLSLLFQKQDNIINCSTSCWKYCGSTYFIEENSRSSSTKVSQ